MKGSPHASSPQKGGEKKKGKFNVDIKSISDKDEERRKITFTQEVRSLEFWETTHLPSTPTF